MGRLPILPSRAVTAESHVSQGLQPDFYNLNKIVIKYKTLYENLLTRKLKSVKCASPKRTGV